MIKTTLIIAFQLCIRLVSAQDIPSKSNTIVITLSDTSNLPSKIAKVFAGKDYSVKPAGKGGLVSTEPRTIKNSRFVLEARSISGAVYLSGRVVFAAQGNVPIEYKGNKGTPIMTAWEEMDKVAKAFKGKVSYSTIK